MNIIWVSRISLLSATYQLRMLIPYPTFRLIKSVVGRPRYVGWTFPSFVHHEVFDT